MSETLMNISNPYVGERRPGTVGLPLPGVSVKLVDGEIWLQGPNVFAGYWRREDATRAAFQDGWFRTGDLAVRSEDGYYTLCGRRSDLIISGGFNIYPREIEEFLMEQEEVAEAAVAAAPDRVRGEVPVAYVVLRQRDRPRGAGRAVPRRARVVQGPAASSWWSTSCRATRWARCRSTCSGAPSTRAELPKGGGRCRPWHAGA